MWPFTRGASRHDFHHSHNSGCYGDWLPFWDWLMGTDEAYTASWAKQQQTAQKQGGGWQREGRV